MGRRCDTLGAVAERLRIPMSCWAVLLLGTPGCDDATGPAPAQSVAPSASAAPAVRPGRRDLPESKHLRALSVRKAELVLKERECGGVGAARNVLKPGWFKLDCKSKDGGGVLVQLQVADDGGQNAAPPEPAVWVEHDGRQLVVVAHSAAGTAEVAKADTLLKQLLKRAANPALPYALMPLPKGSTLKLGTEKRGDKVAVSAAVVKDLQARLSKAGYPAEVSQERTQPVGDTKTPWPVSASLRHAADSKSVDVWVHCFVGRGEPVADDALIGEAIVLDNRCSLRVARSVPLSAKPTVAESKAVLEKLLAPGD